MISFLTGIAIWLLVELAKYLSKITGKTISIRLLVVIICLVAGTFYYWINNFNPELWRQVAVFVSGAFASSQGLWMIMDKFLPKTE